MLHLPQNLRLIRNVADLTQTEFGEKYKATKAMIVSYEGGKANPDDLFIARVCRDYNLNPDDLLSKKLNEEDITQQEEKLERKELPEERLLLEQSVLNLTATQKINATSIDRLVALLEVAFNLGTPGKSHEVQTVKDTATGIRDQPLDLALGKKYSKQKIKGSSQKGDR